MAWNSSLLFKDRIIYQHWKCTAPISSLVEEFKIEKVRLHMMRDSGNECTWRVHPEIKSGKKWSEAETTQEAKSSLRVKDMRVVQNNWAGLSNMTCKFFSKENPKGKRCMVIEVKMLEEEEDRTVTAVTQAKQPGMILNPLNFRETLYLQ